MNGRTARLIRAAARIMTPAMALTRDRRGVISWPQQSYRGTVQRLKRTHQRHGGQRKSAIRRYLRNIVTSANKVG